MAIVFNNLTGGNGGSKLYMHNLRVNVASTESGDGVEMIVSLITNFDTELSNSNAVSLLSNYYQHLYGQLNLYSEIRQNENNNSLYIFATLDLGLGSYPGDTSKCLITVCYMNEETAPFVNRLLLDGSIDHGSSFILLDTVTPL